MALDFPASPSTGATYTGPNGVVWIWDSVKWTVGTQSGAYLPLSGGTLTGNLTVNGDTLLADGAGAGDARVEIGSGRTAAGVAYIDLHAAVGSDSDSRWLRAAGVNGAMTLNNRGTGGLYLGTDGVISLGNYAATVVSADFIASGMRLYGNYLYLGGATGPQNGVGVHGPLIYGDGNYIVNRSNIGYLWKREDDVTVMSMDNGSGNLFTFGGVYGSDLYLRGSQIFFNGNTNSAVGPRLYVDNNNFTVQIGSGGGGLSVINNAGVGAIGLYSSGFIDASGGYTARPGAFGGARGNHFNIDWPGNGPHLWIDNVDQGIISVSCDYRLKENIVELPSTWDQVKALRPITYTHKACPELLREEADPAPRWGFLAHELQETLLPTAASGEKDEPNVVQSPDLVAICAAVTRALQEAMARIEALEGGGVAALKGETQPRGTRK